MSLGSGVVAGVVATEVMVGPMTFKQFPFTITRFSVPQKVVELTVSPGSSCVADVAAVTISQLADGLVWKVNKKGGGSAVPVTPAIADSSEGFPSVFFFVFFLFIFHLLHFLNSLCFFSDIFLSFFIFFSFPPPPSSASRPP